MISLFPSRDHVADGLTSRATVDGALPSSLQDSLLGRLQKLSVGGQEALKTLSVIPEPVHRRDAIRLAGVQSEHIDEGERRGFLDVKDGAVAFRHDLIRRTIEAAMNESERIAKNLAALQGLPEETNPSLLVHCAVEVGDIDRLLELAPRSARYSAAAGGHLQAVEDFREIGPHLDRLSREELGPVPEEWAAEEYVVDEDEAAIRVVGLVCAHYETIGGTTSQSRALAQAVRYLEFAGMRAEAEVSAHHAITVLGPDPHGPSLAQAMEAGTYLQVMAGNVAAVPDLVDRTIEVGDPDILEVTLIRSLNHKGAVTIGADHRHGHESLEQARQLAETAELWDEECRALTNMAWGAAEDRDVALSADLARAAMLSAERHELPGSGRYARALLARALELGGEWDEAAEIARDLIDGTAIGRMVVLPVLGLIEARRGRSSALAVLERGWELANATSEFQRLGPAALALAEWGWINGDTRVPSRTSSGSCPQGSSSVPAGPPASSPTGSGDSGSSRHPHPGSPSPIDYRARATRRRLPPFGHREGSPMSERWR